MVRGAKMIRVMGKKPKLIKKKIIIKPTPCPYCGNYRLEISGEVQCPQNEYCKKELGKKWHNKWQKVTTIYEYFDKKPKD